MEETEYKTLARWDLGAFSVLGRSECLSTLKGSKQRNDKVRGMTPYDGPACGVKCQRHRVPCSQDINPLPPFSPSPLPFSSLSFFSASHVCSQLLSDLFRPHCSRLPEPFPVSERQGQGRPLDARFTRTLRL